MSDFKIEITNGKKKVKFEDDGYGMNLFTMRNGFQWTGMPIDDEMLDMLVDLIAEYKSQEETK